MWFEIKVAWRFLKSGKTQSFLILLGIIIGVSVQTFLGSLIGGLQQDLLDQTVGTSPHITIMSEDQTPRPLQIKNEKMVRLITFSDKDEGINRWQEIENNVRGIKEITAISPTINGSGFALRGQKNLAIVIRGVNIEQADQIYYINNRILEGNYDIGGNKILIGSKLAEELELKVGDSLKINSAAGISDRFIVNGIFNLGSADLNKSWIFMSLNRASTFLDLKDKVSNIELQVNDVFQAEELASLISKENTNIKAESWQENNQQLLTALQSQSSSSIVIQVFVIIAVTLGIASVLAVSVVQKSRQIGILKAMGATNRSVALVFLLQGAFLGIIGSIIGSFSGIGLSQLFVSLVRDEAGNPLFPVQVDPLFIIISITVATIAGMFAALIPARNSAHLSPMEVISNG